MQREIFTSEHDAFRDMVRAFIARNSTPYHEQWERDRVVSREVWRQAGAAGRVRARRIRHQDRRARGARSGGDLGETCPRSGKMEEAP